MCLLAIQAASARLPSVHHDARNLHNSKLKAKGFQDVSEAYDAPEPLLARAKVEGLPRRHRPAFCSALAVSQLLR